jgi:4'-phosphopantetheinyl transferase
MPGIVDRLCHPLDMAMVGALPADLRDHALLALWVRKEACLKAAGTGLATEMNTFPASDEAAWTLPDGSSTLARMLDAGSGWVAAGAAQPGVVFRTAWLRPPHVSSTR